MVSCGRDVGLGFINYVYAHSLPVTENPGPNSIIQKGTPLPSKLTIDFSERPSPTVSTIQVLNSKNEPVNNGDFKIIGDHDREAMTTLDMKKLTDGVYTVTWQTQSLDDGHIAKGSYVFGIGNVGPGAVAAIVSGKASQQHVPQIQAVTSTADGILKWPMIVSQSAIVGGIFSHLFLWEKFGSRITGRRLVSFGFGYDKTDIRWIRRFFIVLVASSVVILAAGTSLLFLQITELSLHNNIAGYWSVFVSQITGPSGLQWMMRGVTSLIVIAVVVVYYYITKRDIRKSATETINTKHSQNNLERKKKEVAAKYNNVKKSKGNLSSSLLYIALIAGSISIFSNSITSHNAGVHFLPSVSVSLDWIHFMAVSIWVGGLFYISTVLVTAIRSRSSRSATTTSSNNTIKGESKEHPLSDHQKSQSIFLYYLALLLPRFSLLATISLGIIGVSGLYMAWIQLHSLTSLFNTAYGNILIIKLSAALPLVLLGAYHQLRLHRGTVLVASLGRRNGDPISSASNRSENIVTNGGKDSSIDKKMGGFQTLSNNYGLEINNIPAKDKGKIKDIPSRFDKTIKIESLIAIGVLLAASLLTITSPPAMNMGMSSMAASMSSSSSMSGMSMTGVKNSTHTIQTKIMNVNTKIEINPFYSGFNTFKVTFTDANGRPDTKVNAVEITFVNTAANMGPIVANLKNVGPGVFSITGAYISQPGEWDIALAAQRVQDLDLNYEFTAPVNNPPSASQSTGIVSQAANNNSMQEAPPQFNSFAWLAIGLAVCVVFGSTFYYRRSKQELRKTIEMLEAD